MNKIDTLDSCQKAFKSLLQRYNILTDQVKRLDAENKELRDKIIQFANQEKRNITNNKNKDVTIQIALNNANKQNQEYSKEIIKLKRIIQDANLCELGD